MAHRMESDDRSPRQFAGVDTIDEFVSLTPGAGQRPVRAVTQVALVASRFNTVVTERLVAGAIEELERLGIGRADIRLVWVPGAFELPAAAARVLDRGQVDAVICLGAVIRGGTPHFEYVSGAVSHTIAELALASSAVVTFGVLTTDTLEQAMERAGGKEGNKGAEAAAAAVEMVQVYRLLEPKVRI
jgi:6,7-dimethyl-8-ribityllumazine synthase